MAPSPFEISVDEVADHPLISELDSTVTSVFYNSHSSNSSQKQMTCSAEGEDKCVICLSGERKPKKLLIPIPCENHCKSFVHAKCIFEWQHGKDKIGSCPLCRGKLLQVEYKPKDPLSSSLLEKCLVNRKLFCMTPVNRKLGMLKCYVKVKNNPWFGSPYLFEMYLQKRTTKRYPHGKIPDHQAPLEGDILLMTAKKRKLNNIIFNSDIDISMNFNFSSSSSNNENYLGTISSNLITGLEYNLKYKGNYLAFVQYQQNRIGCESGPRRMKVILPKVVRMKRDHVMQNILSDTEMNILKFKTEFSNAISTNEEAEAFKTNDEFESDDDDEEDDEIDENISVQCDRKGFCHTTDIKSSTTPLLKQHKKKSESVLYGVNKKPCWVERVQAYSLDFRGRVLLASNKNFQLGLDSKCIQDSEHLHHLRSAGEEEIILQFGKVTSADECKENVSIYTIDFKYPLSPYQAFGICLSSCDRKLGCA